MKTLAIRVSDEDHLLFAAVAALEDMPVSVLVRRQLRALARGHGLLNPADEVANTALGQAQQTQQAQQVQQVHQAPVSATPKLDDLRLPDGTLDHHRLVVRMRTKARGGMTRVQFSKEYNIGLEEMERACTVTADAGHDGSIDEWHSADRRHDLRRRELTTWSQAQRNANTANTANTAGPNTGAIA